jgi:spoIIIJ-associated protein
VTPEMLGKINPVTPENLDNEQKTIRELLEAMISSGGFELEFTFKEEAGSNGPADNSACNATKGRISVEFTGPDVALLTARNGELLNAMENIAAKALRLEPEQHDCISFDADSFKANRDRDLRRIADAAIESVRRTGKPYAFAPMTSRERRLLHLALIDSGLPTASTGEIPRRYVVLYPEGYDATAVKTQMPGESIAGGRSSSVPVSDRAHAIRSSFRRR